MSNVEVMLPQSENWDDAVFSSIQSGVQTLDWECLEALTVSDEPSEARFGGGELFNLLRNYGLRGESRGPAGADVQSDAWPTGVAVHRSSLKLARKKAHFGWGLEPDQEGLFERLFRRIFISPCQQTEEREEAPFTDSSASLPSEPSAILAELRSPTISHERRRQLVIEAEFVSWELANLEELLPVLDRFIRENRDSDERRDLAAVLSAIRTFVAYVPATEAGALTDYLEPGHRAAVPVELELEVAKMAYRKFEANPPRTCDPEPELSARLAELALLYLNPRLLPRDKHAAVAMNACLGLAAMGSEKTSDVFSEVLTSPFNWFRQQLVRRLRRLEARWPKEGEAIDRLQQLIHLLTS